MIMESRAVSIYASNYYKDLYSTPNTNDVNDRILLENFVSVIDEADNSLLVEPITNLEIKNVIKKMNLKKSPGIDGFTVEFYLNFWPIIKDDLTNVMNALINLRGIFGVYERRNLMKKMQEEKL